jgi:BirA family transcriptional regulator, biotin operon repressor / biotin---[acetyl-CoA-carboxylase] ligase
MFGKRRIHFETIDSTNIYAKSLVRETPEEGTVITADFQTAGKGRLDRRWTAQPAVNLLASFLLYPRRAPDDWGGIPLLAGCAVAEALRTLAAVDAQVKWPNDVMIGGRKVCGILVESGVIADQSWVVVGIGINVNQTVFEGEYRLPPASLALESGRLFEIEDVLSSLCRSLDELYALWTSDGNPPIIERWKRRTTMLGALIDLVEHGGKRRVRALDVAADGSLLVENEQQQIETIISADVSIAAAVGA